MSVAEYQEWVEYAALEPFGSHLEDLRAGSIVAATYNVYRDVEKHPTPFRPLDFAPWNSLHGQQHEERIVLGEGLTPEQHSRLIDAQVFGVISKEL